MSLFDKATCQALVQSQFQYDKIPPTTVLLCIICTCAHHFFSFSSIKRSKGCIKTPFWLAEYQRIMPLAERLSSKFITVKFFAQSLSCRHYSADIASAGRGLFTNIVKL